MEAAIDVPLWYWFAFSGLVTLLLVLDLGVFHRHASEPSLVSAALSTLAWCALAVLFNAVLWYAYTALAHDHPEYGPQRAADVGRDKAVEFFTGYLVEWSLSMDNVFVFALIFRFFRVDKKYQYRVLFWGIIGAVVLRLAFILAGTAAVKAFHPVLYVLGAFLIYTGIKLMWSSEEVDPERSLVLRLSRRFLPVSKESYGERFFVVEAGRRCITPLFVVLLVVDWIDMVFALDSVPAIFGISEDPFIVFTSNIFAILGLRSLYFLLAGFMDLFRYLKYGLSAILIFVGVKMLLPALGIHIQPLPSLLVIVSLLGISMLASVFGRHPHAEGDSSGEGPGEGVERESPASTSDH